MELIRKSQSNRVRFDVPTGTEVLVDFERDGSVIGTASGTAVNDYVEVQIPWSVVYDEGQVVATAAYTIDGSLYTDEQHYDVVTPYLTLSQIREVLGSELSQKDAFEAEAMVRHIINSHVGHDFGFNKGSLTVIGQSGDAMYMPRPILTLDRVQEDGQDLMNKDVTYGQGDYLGRGTYAVTGNGWFLKRAPYAYETVKADRSPYYSANPIRLQWTSNEFKNDSTYVVYGSFGYTSVPTPVSLAARLLLEDYSCNEDAYRSKYLESMKTADWRIQYNSGAYRRTGNVKADKLLSPFVIFRAKVF